ncbi:hypothetical protein C0Q70_08298 [Pomacea canaliculata]|uniref:MARVEL domain-containing protein n=1 Tax=Pomacea canaliculata TaxID=400727 RepID=A0A2T7PHE9_POMCA|nr:uncharacterized protein LOC112563077 [Pomacea canaliculata]XP_025092578.1 uncharacterized protein LOC112563077 [Pomacea canaliculata]PVD32851.1 hypothetical protein C0Q70_08298 [Pomacea canaliculata]
MGLYLVESFQKANIFAKLAFMFLLIAEILGWIAFTTTDWGRMFTFGGDYVGYGLWRICTNLICETNDGWLLEWYGVVQAFAIIGFVTLNLGFFLVILFMFVATCKCNSDLSFWNAINCFAGAICWLISIIIFGIKFDDKYDQGYGKTVSYSYILAIIALALMIASGIVLLLTNRGGGAVSSK